MKKIIYIVLSILLLTGCTDISNTPTKQVEGFLNKYQTLDREVIEDLDYIIENEVKFGDVEKEEYPGLKEMDFGPFELKTYEELKDDKEYQLWIQDTFNNKIKGGESFAIQRKRVLSAYDEIIQKYKNIDKDVVILAHGGTIFHIIDNLFKEGKYVYEIQPASGHAYVIDYTKEKISYEKR